MHGGPEGPNRIQVLLKEVWKQKEDITLGRIRILKRTSLALGNRSLTPELRRLAAGEAHKLAGSLGTFGFPEGSRLARKMEDLLQTEPALSHAESGYLVQLLDELCAALPWTSSESSDDTKGPGQ